ncbi:MAG: ATP-binding protein [Bacillota bacterium]
MSESHKDDSLLLARETRAPRAHHEPALARLLEGLPTAAYTCDRDGRITSFNARAAELWGRSPKLNDDSEPLAGALQPCNGKEAFVEKPDGRRVSVLEYASALHDDHGATIGMICLLADIDERKRGEDVQKFVSEASVALAQVADYESTLERIANLAVPGFADSFGVLVREPDGGIRRLAVRHLDPAKQQLIEELYRKYPPDQGKPYGAMEVMARGKPIFVPEPGAVLEEIARDDAHLQMMRALELKSFVCVPMLSRGKVLGALTFATAESGRHYTEMHLHAAEELATRAAIAIENAQLLEALKDADRRKDEFLAMLAHELRNPLAPVRNAVHILRAKSPPGPETQWAHDVIERQVQQMSRLVDDLLDVSRITSGKIVLKRERVALAAAISNAVESSRPVIERGHHELTITVTPEQLHVEADVARLSQIFSNLLTNAAKYTEPGGHIRVSVERDGDAAIVRVSDTGIGIPEKMLGRIFDLFVQVERAGDASQGGLGIGLTLVKRLVEMHGGSVAAKSEGPGRGSEFTVRLPIAGAVAASAGEPSGTYPVFEILQRRILVVDDNKDAADSLAFLLRTHGAETRVAYDGLEAVGAAIAFQPDIVLLDIGLPKLYGYDVARRVREARGKDVLLIAITGWGQEEDRRRAFESGFDHHLTKPVKFEALVRLIMSAQHAN